MKWQTTLPERGQQFEALCEAVHNAWWEEKKLQGISDHPDMIPYAELEESVKEFDRATVRAVFAAMKKLDDKNKNREALIKWSRIT